MKKIFALLFIVLWPFFHSTACADDPMLVIDSGGHMAIIKRIMFTSDGKYLVSAGDDKVVRIWDVAAGKTVRTIRGQIGYGNEGKIYAAALSRNDKYLAVGGWLAGDAESSRAIRLHDFPSGAVIGLLKGHTNVLHSLAFSPDGRYLVSGSSDNTVRLWDVNQRKETHVLRGHGDHIYAVAFSPDGSRLISGSDDKTLRLWDTMQGRLIKEMKGHTDKVWSAAFSPDGRHIASGSYDKSIRLWDAKTGDFIKVLGSQGTNVTRLSFSPDNRWLLTGSGLGGQYISNVFAVPSGDVIARFEKHDNIIMGTAVSRDGKMVATGGGSNNEIYLWNPGNGEVITKLVGMGGAVWSVGYARDGRSIAFGNDPNDEGTNDRGPLQKIITVKQGSDYQVALGGEVGEKPDYLRAIERHGYYEPKTRQGGAYGFQAILQILKAGKVLHEITRDSTSGYQHQSYTFTHDGRYLISGGGNGALTLYDAKTWQEVQQFIGHTGDVWSVAVSPDNQTLVSGSHDQTVKLWDIQSGRNLLTMFVGSDQEWVAWTPQGYYTSSLKGDRYIGWHLNQGEDKAAKYYSASQFQKQFYRPDVVAEYLKSRDIQVAVQRANAERGGTYRGQPVIAAPDVSSFLPPFLKVIAPRQEQSTVSHDSVSVQAFAFSETLPISDLKVFLNGIQVAGGAQGKVKGVPFEREVELEVTLEEGVNTLTFIAANEKATSEPTFRRITYAGRKKDQRPNLILLAIGISEYQDKNFTLDFAHQDAVEVEKAFKTQEGRTFAEVKTKRLTNQQATRADIIRGLDWLRREGTEKDYRLLFLSGHGGLDRQSNYFFYSYDHDPREDLEVYDVRWTTFLDKLTAVPGKAILMVDTCRAAALTGGPKTKGPVNFEEILKEMQSDYRGLVTFAASTGRQMSIEKREWGHGAFTKALLEGLSGRADGYGGMPDGYIDTKELGAWIIDRVRELTTKEQHAIHNQPPELPSFPLFVVR